MQDRSVLQMDMEKVIKGLEICKERNYCCPECPYYDRDAVMGCHSNELMADALALLKEQEAVEPTPLANRRYACGNCGNSLWVSGQRFCASCGKAVMWNG